MYTRQPDPMKVTAYLTAAQALFDDAVAGSGRYPTGKANALIMELVGLAIEEIGRLLPPDLAA